MRKDEAVAPVVAVLLILAVIVTLMSLYYSTYVPSLKEQSEISHLDDVQTAFLSFSSDIENAVWKKSDGRLGRNFDLGGGDVFLSGIKSGGVLEVSGGPDIFGITNSTGSLYNSSLVGFSYETAGNFWQEQRYSWSYGYVNLTTGYGRETPLQYTDMNAVCSAIENDSGIFSSIFDMEYRYRPELEKDAGGNLTGVFYENCSALTVTVAGFRRSEDNYISGNGASGLRLDTKTANICFNETMLNFTVYDNISCNADKKVWECINEKLVLFENEGFSNVKSVCCYPGGSGDDYGKKLSIEFSSSVRVNIRMVNLTISVL